MARNNYNTFADFERDEIRPGLRIGWSLEELDQPSEELDFDADPYEDKLWESVEDDEDEDDEDE